MKKMFKVLFLCLISLGIMSCKMNEGISSTVNGGGTSDSYTYYKFIVDFTQYSSISEEITEVHLIGEANSWDATNKDYVLTKQVDGTWVGTFDASKFRGKYFCVSYNDGGYGKTVRPVMGDDYSSYQGSAILVDKGVRIEGTNTDDDVVIPPVTTPPAGSYTFVLDPNAFDGGANSMPIGTVITDIHLVGELNGWSNTNLDYSLTKQANGTWTGTFDGTNLVDGTDFKAFKILYNGTDWSKVISPDGFVDIVGYERATNIFTGNTCTYIGLTITKN